MKSRNAHIEKIALALAGAAVAPWGGCRSDHDALARRAAAPPSTAGASGDAGGSDSAPPKDATGVIDGALVEASPPDAPGPSGPRRITLVHGVADAVRIVFCFQRVDQGVLGELIGSPMPPAGLQYAEALVVSDVPGVDLVSDSIRPIVIAGDLELLAGLDCAASVQLAEKAPGAGADASASDASPDVTFDAVVDAGNPEAPLDSGDSAALLDGSVQADAPADAGADAVADVATDAPDADATPALPEPPPLRVGELPVIPAGTLAGGRSYLFAAAGCLGGPAFSSPSETAICGSAYTPAQPTLQPVVVTLSRASVPGRLGLQVVNASLPSGFVEVRNTPQMTGGEALIASNVVFGSIAPTPPKLELTAAVYGLADSELSVRIFGSVVASMSIPWTTVIGQSSVASVVDGKTYSLVLVGPRPGVGAFSWWNEPAFALVENDPP